MYGEMAEMPTNEGDFIFWLDDRYIFIRRYTVDLLELPIKSALISYSY
jgi:hypothetical protein